jgi:N-acylneuraminate cytidylyltransferase
MKYLVVIPARGGSKGVPKKNIKLLNNKPLIHYSVETARELFDDEDICVSTDSEEIKGIVESSGLEVPFLRPAELATDTAGSYEVLLHAINFQKEQGKVYDALILLQPTSPFRTVAHIKGALAKFSLNIDMVVSVIETKSNPYYTLFEETEEGFLTKSKEGTFTRRQDCPKVWEYNGAIYIINIASLLKSPLSSFKKIVRFEMDEISSVDIDTELDWIIAETIMENLNV